MSKKIFSFEFFVPLFFLANYENQYQHRMNYFQIKLVGNQPFKSESNNHHTRHLPENNKDEKCKQHEYQKNKKKTKKNRLMMMTKLFQVFTDLVVLVMSV